MTVFGGYRKSWLRGDVLAGITVTAIAIPESLGYASIAGVPVQAGLYCALLPPLLFALFASSRQLVVGADSATAALVAAAVLVVAATGTEQYSTSVAILGLLTAAFLLLMAVARLGFLADLISQPVLTGFLAGVGLSLIIGKLPGMLGIEATGSTFQKLLDTVHGLGDINATSALLAAGTVGVVLGFERFLPKMPAALAGVVVFSVVATLVSASSKGVAMIGEVPAGLPKVAIPTVDWGDVAALLPGAAAIAIVILAQSAAVARSFATKNGYPDDTNKDLVALAAANAGSAFTGGFAINGSPPRTAAGDGAGGRSQVVNLVMAALVAVILLFATGLFVYLPSPVLDAVVFAIGVGLIKVATLKAVWKARPLEFGVAMTVLAIVAFVGVKEGILIGVLISLVDRLRRQYAPRDEVLAENGSMQERLALRVPDVTSAEGLLVHRYGTSLFFENAPHFDGRVRDLVSSAAQPVKAVILDLAAMDDVDYTGAEVIRRLAEDFGASGIRVYLTEMSDGTLAAIEASGLPEVVSCVPRIEDAVRAAVVATKRDRDT